MIKKPDFLQFDTDSWETKVDQKILGWAWSKMGVFTLVSGLSNWLYLKKELFEETDFWCVDKNSEKSKVTLIIFGRCWSKIGMVFWSQGSKICSISRVN